MKSEKHILKKFYDLSIENHVPQAVLKGIPYIGETLYEIIFGSDAEKFIERVMQESNENQSIIIAKFEQIIASLEKPSPCIISFGSGNAEYILELSETLNKGQKHIVKSVKELIGGGGVNFTSRLLATEHEVYPILSIGQDRAGREICYELKQLAYRLKNNHQLIDFIDFENNFYVPNFHTANASIIIHEGNRTIFTQNPKGSKDTFLEFLKSRIRETERMIGIDPRVVCIGHLYSLADGNSENNSGELTKFIIDKYHHRTKIFANFGVSQLKLGIDYWEEYLQKIDLLQLNLGEIRILMNSNNGNSPPLYEIIKSLQERCITTIITLSKFGAIGTYKDGRDGIIIAPPIDFCFPVDPTGAGDAFYAGLTSELYLKSDFSFADFFSAIATGRLWATYACSTLGGAGDCPDNHKLEEYAEKVHQQGKYSIDTTRLSTAEPTIKIFDKAYY